MGESIKPKVVAGFKYILIFASIIMLCFPLKIQSKRFIETVRLAPVIDRLLSQLSDYEFIIYNQDKAALLFYSSELREVLHITDRKSLEEALASSGHRMAFCYLCEADFTGLSPSVKRDCQIIARYKDRLFVANQKDPALFVTLDRRH